MSLNEVGDNDDDDVERRQTENSGYGRRLEDRTRRGCCCHDDETSALTVSRLIDLVVNHRRPLTSEATSVWTPTTTAT